MVLSVANGHDSMVFEELVDAIGPIKRPCGGLRKWSRELHVDRAHEDKKC